MLFRSDAADVLLNLSPTKNIQKQAKDIISQLGEINGNVKTIFDNAQNVHNVSIENSVNLVIEFLSEFPTLKINNTLITYKIIKQEILNNEDVINGKYNLNLIKKSLDRILLDRRLYTKYNISLKNILIKLWSYITSNESRDNMIKRLLEELEEMSGTCSSGFASRLVNVISGYDNFNITISWEDQVISNVCARLNYRVKNILNSDSIYFNENKSLELVNFMLKLNPENKMINVEEYLKQERDTKIFNCRKEFADNVVMEMLEDSDDYLNKKSFSKFLTDHMIIIKNELYSEFKEHLSSDDFELYFRKGFSKYQGAKI